MRAEEEDREAVRVGAVFAALGFYHSVLRERGKPFSLPFMGREDREAVRVGCERDIALRTYGPHPVVAALRPPSP
jgi:hypothetical protein